MSEDRPVHDQIFELAANSKGLLRKLRRSIRSSIAMSSRHDTWNRYDLGGHVAAFGETLEWRNEEIGWELGNLRIQANSVLQRELSEFNEPYLVHAQSLLTVAEHVNTHAATTWRRVAREQEKIDVVCELHSQAILVAEEVLALLKAGLPTGASARWRTLYELCIIGAFLARSPKDTAKRYSASHVVELWNHTELALKETPSRDRVIRSQLIQQLDHIRPDRDRLLVEYGRAFSAPYGWAAKRLGLKRVKFSDIERRVRSGGTRILPGGDRYSYKEASQHIHGERSSSLRTLVQVPGASALFRGAVLEPSLTQAATVWTLQHLTWTLAELVSRTQAVPEALYWGYVAQMFALDADTENWHGIHGIDTGYLRSNFTLA